MNGATLLVKMLQAYDVGVIFGVPGDTNVGFYAALDELDGSIRHVLARDERSAGYMADAYARVTNRPGVVEVPSGAGPMYVLPAIAEANESSVPLILITSDMPLAYEGRGVITELDCAKLLEPITKASLLLKRADKIPETVRRAFRIATSGRPGVVQLVVPEDVMDEEVDPESVSLHAEQACKTFPSFVARAGHDDLVQLQQLIQRAQRPLLVAGGGVNLSKGGDALTRFAERCRIPVVTTITGQNAIRDTHELSIGIVGDNGFHPHANRAMEEADLLVYLGCRIGSVVSIGWTFPAPRGDRQLAQIDICPEFLGNTSRNALSIHADARSVLDQLNALAMPTPARTDSRWLATLNEWRRQFWKHAAEQLEKKSPTGSIKPQAVIEALNSHLSQTHLLFSDPGTATPYLNRFLRLDDPRSRLFIPRAYGGLGYAIPAVVGGWIARPDIRPIGLFGDGSFGMCVGELETIARLKVPAILLNFNNATFGWIKALQRVRGNRRPMSVDFTAQDCSAIARAYGIHALRVETAAQLQGAIDAAFAHAGPVFLDIVVESIADVLPPVYNWLRTTGIDPLAVGGQTLHVDALVTKAELES